jgi:dienelactone hydrolase
MFSLNGSRVALLNAELNAAPSCRRPSAAVLFLVFILLTLGAPSATYAQVLYSTLEGRVENQKGVAVPGVKVEARHVGTGLKKVMVTDRKGWYKFTVVQPGTYRVTFTSASFKTLTKSNITIESNSIRRVDAELEAAEGNESEHENASAVFTYDRSVAFDLKEESAKDQDGVSIRDVNYAALTPRRDRIKAYLVQPGGKGSFAGVLFFHWYGTPNGNRNQFLDESVALAKQGVTSLLIQGYFPWAVPPLDAVTDRQRVIDETIEVRRALDLLLSQPQVDEQRIGYVGHDYGAMYGAINAGVDKRVKAYVLMAGIGSFSNWSLDYWLKAIPAADKEAYRLTLKEIDPIVQIANAAPAALLFQFANSDEHITKEAAIAFSDAASTPKEVKWYDGKHELNVAAAREDRRTWLTRQLRLAKRA